MEEEIQLLLKSTGELNFFQNLNAKTKNREKKLHLQCCQHMSYQFFKRGETILKISIYFSGFYFIDDSPDKFYIILEGSVNVYIPKDNNILLT